MAGGKTRTLKHFCDTTLKQLYRQSRGNRVVNWIAAIQDMEQWNSFDQFDKVVKTLEQAYDRVGADVETHWTQTGGRVGTGRWVIQEAADVRSATLDVVHPLRKRVLDYRENPWQVIQWSAATPPRGETYELVIIDDPEQIKGTVAGSLTGKILLTSGDARGLFADIARTGVAGVINDQPARNNPDATRWVKFGWGGIPLESTGAHLVGLVLSQRRGQMLRRLAARHGTLKLRAKVDIRKYVGAHATVSGIIRGSGDPQDEVWAIAHSHEPGALDNSSGVAACIEIAQIIESLISRGALARPKRSIRLLNAYESYGFFDYLENVERYQTPLAGVCIDAVGCKPELCGGQLEWHATAPMSAGFVDRLGPPILRAALRLGNPGCRVRPDRFISTSDTLLCDPKYGFPCPWITSGVTSLDAYHTSADQVSLLSSPALKVTCAAVGAYLYYLADADSKDVMQLARTETNHALKSIAKLPAKNKATRARYQCELHRISTDRLKRWMWGGDRKRTLDYLADCQQQVRQAAGGYRRSARSAGRSAAGAGRVPWRTAVLTPKLDNVDPNIAKRINATGMAIWATFWADGRRTLADIADLLSCEWNRPFTAEQINQFFEAHVELGYVDLIQPRNQVSRAQLVSDLKKLGLRRGMDVIVHSSLSKIGYVKGGADTVVEALLSVLGKSGTLMMPSFNHRLAQVYNPQATPTVNGAIPDAAWRRADAVRSENTTHAVAAIGPKAQQYCSDHLKTGAFGVDSPIGRLIKDGGYILALGVTNVTSTAYHVAEISMPCGCIDLFANTDRIVGPDGAVHTAPGQAFRRQACPVAETKLDASLDRARLQRHGRVGHARCTLVKAADLFNMRRRHLGNACPTCNVRPRLRST